jgi:hypothetical protein
MATLTLDVPDILVPDLTLAVARVMQDSGDAAVAAIATAILDGETVTNPQRVILAQAYLKRCARDLLLDYRAQQAAVAARRDAGDPAVTW